MVRTVVASSQFPRTLNELEVGTEYEKKWSSEIAEVSISITTDSGFVAGFGGDVEVGFDHVDEAESVPGCSLVAELVGIV